MIVLKMYYLSYSWYTLVATFLNDLVGIMVVLDLLKLNGTIYLLTFTTAVCVITNPILKAPYSAAAAPCANLS